MVRWNNAQSSSSRSRPWSFAGVSSSGSGNSSQWNSSCFFTSVTYSASWAFFSSAARAYYYAVILSNHSFCFLLFSISSSVALFSSSSISAASFSGSTSVTSLTFSSDFSSLTSASTICSASFFSYSSRLYSSISTSSRAGASSQVVSISVTS